MEEKEYKAFRTELARVMRQNENTCREGYLRLWRTESIDQLMDVIVFYWADLNRLLWPEFQLLLQRHYDALEGVMRAHDIYYNVPCERGRCAVDEHCPTDCLVLKGMADAVVHKNASVLLLDQAHATLLDTATAIARDCSSVDARNWSHVKAVANARVRAFDKARVTSDGATDIYLYGTSQLRNICSRRLDVGVSAIVLGPNDNWK